jgi:hypothetical protein
MDFSARYEHSGFSVAILWHVYLERLGVLRQEDVCYLFTWSCLTSHPRFFCNWRMWCRRIHRQLLGTVKRQLTGHHYLLLQHHSHRHKQHRHKQPTMAATIEGCERRFGWNWAYGRCVGNELRFVCWGDLYWCMEGLQTVGYSFLPNWGITCLCKCSMKTAMRYFVLPILTEFVCRYVKMQLCL